MDKVVYVHHRNELNWKEDSIDQWLKMIDHVQVNSMVLTKIREI